MANDDIYIIDSTNSDQTFTDDGKGSDWLVFNGVYQQPTAINLSWSVSNGQPLQAAGSFYLDGTNTGFRLVVTGVIENARGSNGVDDIIGNSVANIIYGDNDRTGAGGNDTISADIGNDTVYGGAGKDSILGDDGKDKLFGDAGNDDISGGGGVDLIQGGKGADTLYGGTDAGDTVSYSESSAGVTVKINYGSTTKGEGGDAQGDKIGGFNDVIGSAENDVLTDVRKDTIAFDYNKNKFDGGAGNDTLRLGGGDDTGIGGTGNDTLYGEAANDTLDGGAGKDHLSGGAGKDSLTGGAGKDVFVFTRLSDSKVIASGRDTILDFSRGEHDRIDLSAIDADKHATGDQKFDFIGNHNFTGEAGELRIKTSGDGFLVMGDYDGDKTEDFSIQVSDVASLKGTDFIL